MADEDRPYDAGDPKDVKAAIKAAQRWDDKRAAVIVGIMSSSDGRRWIREYLERCNVGANPYNQNPVAMAFNCGNLNAGTILMTEVMNAVPELYLKMMAEANPAPEQKDESNG